jgi:hypothetical protein
MSKDDHTFCSVSRKTLRRLARDLSFHDRALVRLMLACDAGKGIRLTADEVDSIVRMDDALHARIYLQLEGDGG